LVWSHRQTRSVLVGRCPSNPDATGAPCLPESWCSICSTIDFGTYAFSIDPLQGNHCAVYAGNLAFGAADSALRACYLVEMDTAGCALVIGLGDTVGTLEPGKCAKLAAASLRKRQFAAAIHPCESPVYVASSRRDTHTIVGGAVTCANGGLTRLDTDVEIADGPRLHRGMAQPQPDTPRPERRRGPHRPRTVAHMQPAS
jgi:hypothetical protein